MRSRSRSFSAARDSESLQQHLEAVQFGKESAADASAGAQTDAAAIFAKAAK